MNKTILRELKEVERGWRLLVDFTSPWVKELTPYRESAARELHWLALPALTIAVNRYFKADEEQGVYLAAIFGLLYLADYIHGQVRNDEQGQKPGPELHFAIVSGDYLFSRAVQLLDEIKGSRLTGEFSELMAAVNEGHVLRQAAGDEAGLEYLIHEKALFYRYCFAITARAAGAGAAECGLFGEIGDKVGTAMVLAENDRQQAGLTHLEMARNLLDTNAYREKPESSLLGWLLDELILALEPQRAVAAL